MAGFSVNAGNYFDSVNTLLASWFFAETRPDWMNRFERDPVDIVKLTTMDMTTSPDAAARVSDA